MRMTRTFKEYKVFKVSYLRPKPFNKLKLKTVIRN